MQRTVAHTRWGKREAVWGFLCNGRWVRKKQCVRSPGTLHATEDLFTGHGALHILAMPTMARATRSLVQYVVIAELFRVTTTVALADYTPTTSPDRWLDCCGRWKHRWPVRYTSPADDRRKNQ